MARTLDLAKRKAILKAARSIFIKDGYAVAKMSDIASEAGVAQGTLYLYYESKELLASAIGEEFFSRLITQFVAIVRQIKDPDGVISLVDCALRFADQDRVILTMVKERNHRLQSKKDGRKRFVAQVAEALSDLMSAGVIRPYGDATMLADLLLALMRRVIMSYAIFEDENIDQLRAGAVTMLQYALFDDVTMTASRLLKRKRKRKV